MPFSKGSDLESQRCLFLWWAGNRGLNPQRWFLGNYNEICPAGLWNSKKKKKHSFKIHKHVCKPEVTFIKLTCDFRGFCDNLQLCFSLHKYKLSLSFWYSVQKLVCPKSLTNNFWSLSAVLLLCNCIFFFYARKNPWLRHVWLSGLQQAHWLHCCTFTHTRQCNAETAPSLFPFPSIYSFLSRRHLSLIPICWGSFI